MWTLTKWLEPVGVHKSVCEFLIFLADFLRVQKRALFLCFQHFSNKITNFISD